MSQPLRLLRLSSESFSSFLEDGEDFRFVGDRERDLDLEREGEDRFLLGDLDDRRLSLDRDLDRDLLFRLPLSLDLLLRFSFLLLLSRLKSLLFPPGLLDRDLRLLELEEDEDEDEVDEDTSFFLSLSRLSSFFLSLSLEEDDEEEDFLDEEDDDEDSFLSLSFSLPLSLSRVLLLAEDSLRSREEDEDLPLLPLCSSTLLLLSEVSVIFVGTLFFFFFFSPLSFRPCLFSPFCFLSNNTTKQEREKQTRL